jgi:septum formation protein
MKGLVLASSSPRRKELLAGLGISFEIVPSEVDETLPRTGGFGEALWEVALRKVSKVRGRLRRESWILAADTAVILDVAVFGKPQHRREAADMLRALSGQTHRVVTGVALAGPSFQEAFSVETEVDFRSVSEPEIEWYTSLDEPYDKAGAYAIQGRGASMIKAIRGSYTNVVGLPLAETVMLLERAGLAPWSPLGPFETHGF